MTPDAIRITGARQHNLKDVSIEIPRNRLVVITGLSGSGKSSLAFDTLYAEGQRRYVESLSAYARQFLDRLDKPDVDFIEGLSPAIAIEQRTSAANPRSTVATTTEIYDYLRILYAAAGQPHDPTTGAPIRRRTIPDITAEIASLDEGTRAILLAPLASHEPGDFRHLFERLRKQGYVRIRVDGEIRDLEERISLAKDEPHTIEVVVDRLVVRDGIQSRLTDSLATAFRLNKTETVFLLAPPDAPERWSARQFTTAFANPATGFRMPELNPRLFSFNSHQGACQTCHGLGSVLVCDPHLLVPDPSLSLDEGAVRTWWSKNRKLRAVQDLQIDALARHFRVDRTAPFAALDERFKHALFHGTGGEPIAAGWKSGGSTRTVSKPFEGLAVQAGRLHETSGSEVTRRNVRRFLVPDTCPDCQGRRLKPEVLAVTLANERGGPLGIHGFCALSVRNAIAWIDGIALTQQQETVCRDVVREIERRLRFLDEVGLGYLTLERESGTLSGGEAQRIRLASQIGGGLAGVLYVLDEPSIGLHQHDNDRLIGTLKRLRDLGNTVVVVEHDAETMRSADWLIDLGPGAGPKGGEIMAQGRPEDVAAAPSSLTGRYLSGTFRIPVPARRIPPQAGARPAEAVIDSTQGSLFENGPPSRRATRRGTRPGADAPSPPPAPAESGWLIVRAAVENNLQSVDAAFPVGCLTCVTGASGSGKSTLVDTVLKRALFRHFYRSKDIPGKFAGLEGLDQFDKAIVIDQAPIGRSPRSNPVTYIGAFNPIRNLFAALPAAKVRGYGPGHFSFNVAGGRCETCKGDGSIKIDMHFLSDVYVTCEACGGHRYNPETLEITYKGRNIAEVLELDAEEAARFFRTIPAVHEKLRLLCEVGLGYLKLGQPANTLSGGEAQRVKLAAELSRKATGRTLYLLDEPTTGLHFADIETLLSVLYRLRDAGNTLVVIEHNLDVVKCADWIIDLGPGGGEEGGRIVAEGTPEEVAANPDSLTGRYLSPYLDAESRSAAPGKQAG